MELERIREQVTKCTLCPLSATRTNAVPGEGATNAELVLVGEAPGVTEDSTGRPFVGKSGKLLSELLEGIGLERSNVYITSILKCRPPRNRAPLKSEVALCLPYLERQIKAIAPRFVVLLGGVAISSLIGPWSVSDAHGRFYEGESLTYFMTYHPAAALRFPKTLELMKSDFQVLRRELLGA